MTNLSKSDRAHTAAVAIVNFLAIAAKRPPRAPTIDIPSNFDFKFLYWDYFSFRAEMVFIFPDVKILYSSVNYFSMNDEDFISSRSEKSPNGYRHLF